MSYGIDDGDQVLSENEYVLENLHALLAHNVIGDRQYKARYIGFRGELDFFKARSKKHKIFSGGFFRPAEKGADTLDNPIYFTVNSNKPTLEYEEIYKAISRICCKKMFYIFCDCSEKISTWNKIDVMGVGVALPVPKFYVYEFDPKSFKFSASNIEALLSLYPKKIRKNKPDTINELLKSQWIGILKNFNAHDILQLYLSRLIFDGYIGGGDNMGLPSDIDAITKNEEGKYNFLEIKEKYLSKSPSKGFGMDIPRIKSLLILSKMTRIQYYYVVREVDDCESRNFISWRYLDIDRFIENLGYGVLDGGTGMRHEKAWSPTKLCPQEKFLYLEREDN